MSRSACTIREYRPADLPGIARVQVDTWRSTYRGIVPQDFLDTMDVEEREKRLRRFQSERPALAYFVAVEESGQVVGFAAGGPERDDFPGHPGELYAIYILPEFQALGLGRSLVRAVFERLEAAGLRPAVIWVLAENPACAFYRRLGGIQAGEKWIEIGGKRLKEIGFSFRSLDV